MQKSICGIAAMAVLLVSAGCRLPLKAAGGKEAAGPLSARAAGIVAAGGFAAEGSGRAKSIADAVDRAKAQAKAGVERAIGTALDAMEKDFASEPGERGSTECKAFFESVLTKLKSEGAPTLTAMEYGMKDGFTVAHVLMEVDPRAVISAMDEVGRKHKSLLARLSVSKAFKGLDERARKYHEFRRQQGLRAGEVPPLPLGGRGA
jgi:hypothetical protein